MRNCASDSFLDFSKTHLSFRQDTCVFFQDEKNPKLFDQAWCPGKFRGRCVRFVLCTCCTPAAHFVEALGQAPAISDGDRCSLSPAAYAFYIIFKNWGPQKSHWGVTIFFSKTGGALTIRQLWMTTTVNKPIHHGLVDL